MKKLFNFKNIMFVFCVGIAIISTFFSCEVRAYTKEDFNDFIDQILANTNINSTVRDHANTFKYYSNDIYNYMESNGFNISDYKGISVWASGSGLYYTNMYINLIPNNATITNSSGTYYCQCDYVYRDKGYWFSKGTGNAPQGIASTSETYAFFGLLDGLIPLTNNMIFENYYTPTIVFDYSPYGFQLSGDSATYWNKFAYVSGFIPLGVLGNNEYYQLDIKLRDANGYDVANYSDVPSVGSISDDNSILKVENSVVFVNAIYLSYYRNYNLLFKVWDNSNDFESFIYSYKFMPFSAVIENGQIVSSGDTNFSGADSTILITDNLNDYSDVDNIMGILGVGDLFVSGDHDFIVSGDLFTLLGYSDYDNSYKDFIYNGIYHNLKDVFLSSNDREFTFLFMNRIITINSNSFTTPNGVLKTFVSSFLVFGTIYYFYKTTIHFYHKMQEGNQLEAVQTWSVDDESILM